MHSALKKIKIFYAALRVYSLPISFMSWLVPFISALFNKGSAVLGIIALLGIIVLHLGANIFDDAVDYLREKKQIDAGLKTGFNFQKEKCICILRGEITLKQAFLVSFALFFTAFCLGIFFINVRGAELLYIIAPCALLCLLYPFLGSLGLGEVIISIIFAPLLYSGVYFVMTGSFSSDILIFSVSTGLLTTAVLHNHMLLDYKFDLTNRKITLCRLCGNEKKALILLCIIIALAYINLIFWILTGKLSFIYILPIVTVGSAANLLKVMNNHINRNEKDDFLNKFMLAQNLLASFTIFLCVSIVINYIIINN